MGIGDSHFNAVVENLAATLAEFGVSVVTKIKAELWA
jgi:hypothetical protein